MAALLIAGPSQPIAPEAEADLPVSAAIIDIDDASGRIVVEVDGPESFDAVYSLLIENSATVTFASRATGRLSVEAHSSIDSLVSELGSLEGVVSVSGEKPARIKFTPNDPEIPDQWALEAVNAYNGWDLTLGSHEVVVGVLDTGIDWDHPDIEDNIWTNSQGYHGYNFVDDNWFPMDDNVNGYDDDGNYVANIYTYHGTHVAGIVGAAIDNTVGIAGLAQVRLMAVKVMNDSGEGTDSMVASGIRWAVDNDAHVIVMSLGVDGMSVPLENAANYATSRGVVLVAAAGNNGESVLSYPAAFPNVIAVGATDSGDNRAEFSNFGTGLDVVAPGVQIYSTQGGGSYQYLSGTSAAAPHVAGVAALMLSVNPALTPAQVGNFINETARDVSRVGYDSWTGWGVVNAFGAVEAVSEPTVTIVEHPESVKPNATYSVTWMVSGGEPGIINSTYLSWGISPLDMDDISEQFDGVTWAEFTVSDLPSLPGNGTIYLSAFAIVDGILYESDTVQVQVIEGAGDSFFMQFIDDIREFILDDLGLVEFLLIMFALVAIVAIAMAVRPKKRRAPVQTAPQQVRPQSNLNKYQAMQGVHYLPPPPPPPPRYEAYVDIVGGNLAPPVIKVIEGTKVVWVNRTWAPPPGVSIKSGTVDHNGEHPSGMFQSGLLVAPGDYWSCTFHKAGEYDYFLTSVGKTAKIVVEPYREGAPPRTET